MVATRILRDVPIRQKLRIITLTISGITVLAACGAFVFYQWTTARDLRAGRLQATSDVVGMTAVPAVEFGQPDEAAASLGALRADPLMESAAVYGMDGSLFASWNREGSRPVPSRPEPDGWRYEGGQVLTFEPLMSGKNRIGTIHLRADLADLRAQLWTSLAAVGVLLAVAVAGILVLGGRLGRTITLPIQRLSAAVQSVRADKDYSVRVEGVGRDELGRLMDGFNEMLGAIQERDAALAKAKDELELRVEERTRDLQQEVADRKAAQKVAQEKEARLVEAQEIAQFGSWDWDPANNSVTWSDELYRITGVLPGRFGGTLDEGLLLTHPEDRKAMQEAMERCRDTGQPFESDVRIIRPGGSIRHLRVHGKPVKDGTGKAVRLVGTAQDVTERRRAEEAIRKLNEDLTAANKELEGFSYSVSHDLRAPLRAIHGYSQMLMEDYAKQVEGEGRRFLEVISQNTRKMGQLIDDLLDFSRLSRKALVQAPVDLRSLFQQVTEEAALAAPGRRFEFRIGDLPPARGDSSMLRVAIVNLVANAVKYTRGRDPAVIEIGARPEGTGTLYYVKDNGVGFEMEYANKLFGVFQRLHRSEEFEGTGVGLALVQRIIQRHGGRVAGEGRVDQGATFSFTLPRPEGAEAGIMESGSPKP